MGDPLHDHTPPSALIPVELVGLKCHGMPSKRIELGSDVGSEHDGLAVDDVIHGDNEEAESAIRHDGTARSAARTRGAGSPDA